MQHVLVTGGAGYVGSVLVGELLDDGTHVTVLDRFFFGNSLHEVAEHGHLELVNGDIRDATLLRGLLSRRQYDAVIHLAAISNDPSSELDPELTKSINKTAVDEIIEAAHAAGVKRFLYASSASVYGIKNTPDVTEDMTLEPITLYARYKAEGEDTLWRFAGSTFCGVAVRAATVCGWSPRLRLDLTINLLTEQALTHRALRVFGGSQMRPNVHIKDLTRFYRFLLEAPAGVVSGRAFNVTHSNATVFELAEMIRETLDPSIPINIVATDDKRSYHLSADRAHRQLGFVSQRPLDTAVSELQEAFRDRRIVDPARPVYRNIELMKKDPAPWRQPQPASEP